MITELSLRLISAKHAGQGREYALLELAQEHFLEWMRREHLFEGDPDDVVFKGGTAIRKFRLGERGRFSTDLDFAVADQVFANHVLESLDNGLIRVDNVVFERTGIDLPAGKADWIAHVEDLGHRTIEAEIEFTLRPTLLPPRLGRERATITGLEAGRLGFEPPLIPLMRIEENIAEKLARFRRTIRSRDLYDLAALGRQVRDHLDLVRNILCFKVYFDIVRDGRVSTIPFLGGSEFENRNAAEIADPDDLGLIMGGTVDYDGMLASVHAMFGPMGPPATELERRLARVNRGDLYMMEQEYDQLRQSYRISPPPGDE